MADTKPRRAPQKREYGMVVDVRLFVPVDRNNLDNQIAVSQAVRDVQATGETKDLFAIPGARAHSLLRPARFEALRAADTGTVVGTADEGQTDIEDAIADDDSGEDGKAGDMGEGEPATEETAGRRGRGRSAA